MPNIKTQSIIDYFLGLNKKVFTINDVARLTGKRKAYLSRLLPTNSKFKRIEKGKYYVDDPDVYEIASNIVNPSYISLMSAFTYNGLTTQMPVKISVITTLRHKKMNFNGMAIDFITLDAGRIFGYKKVENIRIATAEKSFVDSLYLSDPPYADIEEAFEKAVSEGILNFDRLKEYAIEMMSGPLINRLGFLLDSFAVDAGSLLQYKAKRPVLLFGKGTKKNKKWGVLYD